tara:strand:+ start:176 stop:541 length:366 start_codon:yes stop_codon:yes gene_type:complete
MVVHQGYDTFRTSLRNWDLVRDMKLSITQWDEICDNFREMFQGLGIVKTTDVLLSFSSIEPYVSTGISLARDGAMAANMPLHNLDSRFDTVTFDELFEKITLSGHGFTYTYKIPEELLSIR